MKGQRKQGSKRKLEPTPVDRSGDIDPMGLDPVQTDARRTLGLVLQAPTLAAQKGETDAHPCGRSLRRACPAGIRVQVQTGSRSVRVLVVEYSRLPYMVFPVPRVPTGSSCPVTDVIFLILDIFRAADVCSVCFVDNQPIRHSLGFVAGNIWTRSHVNSAGPNFSTNPPDPTPT